MADAAELDRAVDANDPSRDDRQKRRQILEGARDVLLRHGFDGASMNEVARVAGVSKGTLYVYFSSKEELFETLIREEKRAQAEQMCRFEEDGSDIRIALSRFGIRLLDLMLRPSSIAHLRTVAAASAKFPQIGRAYYEAGPQVGMQRLGDYLRGQATAGVVAIEDFDRAAGQFTELCKGYYLTRAIFGVGDTPHAGELKAHVAQSVEFFMRVYGSDAQVARD